MERNRIGLEVESVKEELLGKVEMNLLMGDILQLNS